MSKNNYKVGDKLNFVGGTKIQITGVNADGTANFSEINPSTKKPYPFSKGLHGKLPSLSQQAEEKIKLTSDITNEDWSDIVTLDDYESHDDMNINLDLTNNVGNKYNFVNLAGFKKFLQNNIGNVKMKLVDSPATIVRGNLGDSVITHKSLGKTRTVDKVSSSGFYLDGVIVDWGKANEWKFYKNQVVWTGEDGHYLAYEIVD